MKIRDVEHEALVFGKYLLKKTPNEKVTSLYVSAIEDQGEMNARAVKNVAFASKHPRLLRLVDSGLAIIEPESEVRRRLYIMFAILESSAEYHTYFLPKKRSPLYILTVGITGIGAVLRAVVGVVIVKAVMK